MLGRLCSPGPSSAILGAVPIRTQQVLQAREGQPLLSFSAYCLPFDLESQLSGIVLSVSLVAREVGSGVPILQKKGAQ